MQPANKDALVPPASGASRLALLAVRAYQLLLSPLFGGHCRFLPSCSEYASEAVAIHGPMRGSWLTFRRLIRCHPFCEGGLDQVPVRHRS